MTGTIWLAGVWANSDKALIDEGRARLSSWVRSIPEPPAVFAMARLTLDTAPRVAGKLRNASGCVEYELRCPSRCWQRKSERT